jgi:hypothetical protein
MLAPMRRIVSEESGVVPRALLPLARRVYGYLPRSDWFLNVVVNKLPYRSWRHLLYELAGVRFVDRRSGCIMLGAQIHHPSGLRLGRNSIIGAAHLDARGGIEIGENVNITGATRFMTAKHDVQDPEFPAIYSPIVVHDRAWIALGATVLGGVTIGEGAVVTANATVTKDVAPYTIVGGTPAREIGSRDPNQTYELDYRPNWT